MPKPQPPPMRLLAVEVTLQQLKLVIPLAALVIAALAVVCLAIITHQRAPLSVESPEASAPVIITIRPESLAAVSHLAAGALPPAVPEQRRPPCDPDVERELKGACWVPLAVERCPRGKAFVNDDGPGADGKCYARAGRDRTPTSGDVRPTGVADP